MENHPRDGGGDGRKAEIIAEKNNDDSEDESTQYPDLYSDCDALFSSFGTSGGDVVSDAPSTKGLTSLQNSLPLLMRAKGKEPSVVSSRRIEKGRLRSSSTATSAAPMNIGNDSTLLSMPGSRRRLTKEGPPIDLHLYDSQFPKLSRRSTRPLCAIHFAAVPRPVLKQIEDLIRSSAQSTDRPNNEDENRSNCEDSDDSDSDSDSDGDATRADNFAGRGRRFDYVWWRKRTSTEADRNGVVTSLVDTSVKTSDAKKDDEAEGGEEDKEEEEEEEEKEDSSEEEDSSDDDEEDSIIRRVPVSYRTVVNGHVIESKVVQQTKAQSSSLTSQSMPPSSEARSPSSAATTSRISLPAAAAREGDTHGPGRSELIWYFADFCLDPNPSLTRMTVRERTTGATAAASSSSGERDVHIVVDQDLEFPLYFNYIDVPLPLIDPASIGADCDDDTNAPLNRAHFSDPSSLMVQKCFNCNQPGHQVSACPRSRHSERMQSNRDYYNSRMGSRGGMRGAPAPGRYYTRLVLEELVKTKLRPGHLSERLRKALGMKSTCNDDDTESDCPPYYPRMRSYGYPPGYMEKPSSSLSSSLSSSSSTDANNERRRHDGFVDPNDDPRDFIDEDQNDEQGPPAVSDGLLPSPPLVAGAPDREGYEQTVDYVGFTSPFRKACEKKAAQEVAMEAAYLACHKLRESQTAQQLQQHAQQQQVMLQQQQQQLQQQLAQLEHQQMIRQMQQYHYPHMAQNQQEQVLRNQQVLQIQQQLVRVQQQYQQLYHQQMQQRQLQEEQEKEKEKEKAQQQEEKQQEEEPEEEEQQQQQQRRRKGIISTIARGVARTFSSSASSNRKRAPDDGPANDDGTGTLENQRVKRRRIQRWDVEDGECGGSDGDSEGDGEGAGRNGVGNGGDDMEIDLDDDSDDEASAPPPPSTLPPSSSPRPPPPPDEDAPKTRGRIPVPDMAFPAPSKSIPLHLREKASSIMSQVNFWMSTKIKQEDKESKSGKKGKK